MGRWPPIRTAVGAALVAASLILAAGACTPRIAPAGPPRHTAAIAGDYVVTADGVRLPLRRWSPESKPQAAVVALHGFNDYSAFFDGPGRFLAARGVISYAYDQRGFGSAPGAGIWAGTKTLVDDARTVTRLVHARHPGVPLYLLGASMGGAVAMLAISDDLAPSVDGVILSAPAVWARETMPVYMTASLWLAAHTVPYLKVSARGLEIVPSDNKEMLIALGKDPLVIKDTRVDSVYGMVNLMDRTLADAGRFTARALILYGAHDEIIPPRATALLSETLPVSANGRQRFAFYPDGYHMLLRDLQARTVWKDIAAWIKDPEQPLPSGNEVTGLGATEVAAQNALRQQHH
jgi:alpha-beta hydrolase superfamily lysophospholipase